MLAEFMGDDAISPYLTERWRTTSGEGATARVQTRTRGATGRDRSRPRSDTASTSKGIILAFAGKVLLRPTSLKLERGRRYGMVGQNGAGKTTLLTRLAAGDINGFPKDIRCVFIAARGARDLGADHPRS